MPIERIPPVIRPETPQRTPLELLIAEFGIDVAANETEPFPVVTGISLETRSIRAGDLFVAVQGKNAHGAEFSSEAEQGGAVAVLTDQDGVEAAAATGLPVLVLENLRSRLGDVSAFIYGTNKKKPLIFGITGTNGKTTTAHVLDAVLRQLGLITGLSSTAERHIAGETFVSRLTTPESTDLHALVARMHEVGVQAVVLEVSAQGLSHHRVDGLIFDSVGFTNLSNDHLDDYGTMETYFKAKELLFTPEHARAGVVSLETAWGVKLRESTAIPVTAVSNDPATGAEWLLTITGEQNGHTAFTVELPGEQVISTSIDLIGAHLVADAALALVMIVTAGFTVDQINAAIGEHGIEVAIPGRTERVSGTTGPQVFVDFGHSSDAFEKTIAAVRQVTTGRLLFLFGADGDRDPVKRPEMARVAAAGADVVIVTDHHPRFEDPASIRQTLVKSASEAFPEREIFEVSPPEAAIEFTVQMAKEGDSILWAGPGHQDYRDIQGVRTPYSARQLARDALNQKGWPTDS